MPTEKPDLEQIEEKYKNKYAPILKKITEDFQKQKMEHISEYRGTLQNLLIVSAAIASFSIPLAGNNSNNYIKFLIGGISLLILNTLVIFGYLLSKQSISGKKLKQMETEIILPFGKFRENYLKLFKKEIDIDEYLKIERDNLKYFIDTIPNTFEEEPTDNLSILFFLIFTTGISLIIFSIIAGVF